MGKVIPMCRASSSSIEPCVGDGGQRPIAGVASRKIDVESLP
jgi:hypothetical protein